MAHWNVDTKYNGIFCVFLVYNLNSGLFLTQNYWIGSEDLKYRVQVSFYDIFYSASLAILELGIKNHHTYLLYGNEPLWSHILFHVSGKKIQVWNDMRVSKW